MENEHDWLMIGSEEKHVGDDFVRVFRFRCKWCNEEDEAFSFDGSPTKRNMIDECKRD